MDQYLSCAEVAARLCVSERTVVYWAARSLVPGAIKIGRQWRFRLTTVEEWLQEKHLSQQKEVHHWPTSISERDPASIKRALGLAQKSKGSPLEERLLARLSKKPIG